MEDKIQEVDLERENRGSITTGTSVVISTNDAASPTKEVRVDVNTHSLNGLFFIRKLESDSPNSE